MQTIAPCPMGAVIFLLLLFTSLTVTVCSYVEENGQVEDYARTYNLSVIGLPESLKSAAKLSQSAINQYLNDAVPAYFRITQKCFNIRFFLDLIITRIRLGGTVNQIEEMFTSFCSTLGLVKVVCVGLAERFVPTFHYIVTQRNGLNADACTGIIFQQLGCTTNDPYVEWDTDDPTDSASTEDKLPHKKTPSSRKAKEPLFSTKLERPLKILHLTDIHVDPLYTIGSNANCENKLLCCRRDDGKPANRHAIAGKYGSSQSCDLPMWTFENGLMNIKVAHPNLDLIYISGDFMPHNMWNTSKLDNTKETEYVSKTIRRYIQGTQIIPILGNHEPHPVNMFSPANAPMSLSTQWVFNVTKNAWMNWIPPSAANDYIRHHYYSFLVNEKFRVLVINTNICFGFNFWQLYSFDDFKLQLRWLRSQLEMSSKSQEAVHIVGHVPPGHIQCSKVFSRNYYNIIVKYASVVKGQFFGHTHVDTFRLFYNKNGELINPQWISPSLTPFRSNNPAYKIYYVDPQSVEVIDHETYILDLEKANANKSKGPKWFKLYSATALYQVPNVNLTNLALIMDKMTKNESLFTDYYRLQKKGVDFRQSEPCGTYCRKRALCRIVTPYIGEKKECDRVQMKIDEAVVPIYYDDPI